MRSDDVAPSRADLVVRDDAGREVHRAHCELAGEPVLRQCTATIDARLAPGLYHVEVNTGPSSTTTGFWIYDAALLARGARISVSRDWLRRDGEVFPVIGTTYMASDVHRKFLFDPDPHVWDRDFAQMRRLGINLVRTGIWTGWSRVMLNPGSVDEAVLRALDAYVLSAAKHDIVVNFTFFAFLPPAYGGVNPYLDPRSLEGQRELLTAVARRYRGVPWIHYDLINEPSYAPPEGLWSNRPIRDPLEKEAWREWIRRNHGEEDAARLRARWQDEELANHLPVRAIMTPAPIIVEPNTSADEAARLMLVNHISCLPVMRGETLVGIITTSDILMAFMTMHKRSWVGRQEESAHG